MVNDELYRLGLTVLAVVTASDTALSEDFPMHVFVQYIKTS